MRKCDKRFCMGRDISECKIPIQHDTAAVNGKLIANSRKNFATHGSVELGSSSWLGLYKFVQDHMTTWIVKCIHFHLGSSASNVTQPSIPNIAGAAQWFMEADNLISGSRRPKHHLTSGWLQYMSIYFKSFWIYFTRNHLISRSPKKAPHFAITDWQLVDPVACYRMVPYLFEG